MRGNYLHNWMAREVQALFIAKGFTTYLEHRISMPDGRINYVDMLAIRGLFCLAVEFETSERYVLVNASKARSLQIPLWIVTHDHRIKHRIEAKFRKHLLETYGIKFLLLTSIKKELRRLKGIKFPG